MEYYGCGSKRDPVGNESNTKNWLKAILFAAIMLAVMFLVAYGAWWLLVDTGRAIVH